MFETSLIKPDESICSESLRPTAIGWRRGAKNESRPLARLRSQIEGSDEKSESKRPVELAGEGGEAVCGGSGKVDAST